jgi:hypothetical protein
MIGAQLNGLKLYILGFPGEFRGNDWKRDVEESAIDMGWRVVHRAAQGANPDEVLREARDADIFIWLRTNHNNPHGDAYAMLRRIEDTGVPTAGMHMDLYHGIVSRKPMVNPVANPWFSCQRVYTADGGHDEEFAAAGIRHEWMPPAMGDRHFGLREPGKGRMITRYAFVGTCSRGIHGGHRSLLLAWAARRYGRAFKQYGVNSRVIGEDLNQLYAKARIAIGDSATSDRYWSDRIPTTMGRGGVLAHPYVEGMDQHGYSSDNMLIYDRYDFAALGEMIDSASDSDISRMREAALTVTWERHRWRHRLESIARAVLQ